MKIGDVLSTPYGDATLSLYREVDQTYVLTLPFGGTLYANSDSLAPKEEGKSTNGELSLMKNNSAMELNEAYEALETMRRLNLDLECQERGLEPSHDECTACLLSGDLAARQASYTGRMSNMFKPKADAIPANFSRLKQFVATREEKSKAEKCLLCGAPTCSRHSAESFRRECITVCETCNQSFRMEFVVDCLTLDKDHRRKRIDKLIDLYDRAQLLLQFSSQYIDSVIEGLEQNKDRDDKINFGGSSAGIASGVLGIAAAATIITPAGVPLLIASLMLGAGATGVQTGTEVHSKYFSEPSKFADRILALHGMMLSILSTTGTLRDAATRDHIRTDAFDESVLADLQKSHIGNRTELLAGMTAGRFAVGSAELMGLTEGVTLARSARMFSRSGTAAMRTLRFARFAGGALAAATLLLEANSMAKTVQSIKDGSPCEKADALRKIKEEMHNLPATDSLDKECTAYLSYMDQRGRRMKEEEAVKLLLEVAQEDAERQEARAADTGAGGDLILEGAEDEGSLSTPSLASGEVSQMSGSGSLMQRIQLFKRTTTMPTAPVAEIAVSPSPSDQENECPHEAKEETEDNTVTSSSSSLRERIELFKKGSSQASIESST